MTVMNRLAFLLVVASMTAGGSEAFAQAPTASVAGVVSVVGADGQPLVLPGVTLSLGCSGREARTEVTNEQGEFRFADVPPGTCSVVAELQGFKSASKTIALGPGETSEMTLRLDLDSLHEEVNVSASAGGVE